MTLFEIVQERNNRRWLYALAVVVVVALLVAWYWHGYAGSGETDAMISRLRESAATSERRADAIIDATRQREVTARAQVKRSTADLPANQLVAALEQMLAEYRAGR
ncbi:transposase [Pyramidobacter sp.]|uniref:transposase n=1 Tax=Pyramidobacter sp. TaxID=1943581 RepID=UPI0025FD46B8|nr:transposase [Pyramidobacter sp.]MCI7403623.1 transposase [Pyramidobacter sp.]MDY3213438.1 transposase [Pyramidobacter sp.]